MTSNCNTFFKQKKLQKSVTIWEHLPKRYHLWTIRKQKKEKSVTIWKKCDNLEKKCDNLGKSVTIWKKSVTIWSVTI